ncbi:MAG: enoyl-CoA hydratase/isomerase family protein [Thermoanaerobaculia bacterium]
MTDRFRTTLRSGILELRFDDGGMNLLSAEALSELSSVLDAMPSGVRLLAFRSGRRGLFAAGADMAEMKEFDWRDAVGFAEKGQTLFGRIERLPFPTAAIIDGDCFGGALDLAMSFDFRFSSAASRFSHPGSKIGIPTGFGGTSRWRKLIGRTAAARLLLDNAVFDAAGAERIGMVDEVCDPEGAELEARLQRLSRTDGPWFASVREILSASERLTPQQVHLLAKRHAELHSSGGSHGTA